MAATGQEMAYRCEQCGSPEIVALSQLYEQGTRSFSGRFTSGVSQSYTAKAASPPRPRSYLRALFGWGFPIVLLCLLGYPRIQCAIAAPQERPMPLKVTVAVLLLFGLYACLGVAFQFLQDRPLQPRGLPASPFGLGAHLHVPPLRKVLSDSSVAAGARSLREYASNAQ